MNAKTMKDILSRVMRGETTATDAQQIETVLPVWRCVTEFRPHPLVDVLVIHTPFEGEAPTVDIGYIDKWGMWQLSGADELAIAPSHWMPLPSIVGVLS